MKIALLIDADNTPPQKLQAVYETLSARGSIPVCRAYANWQKEIFKSWDGVIRHLPIEQVHQPDFATGKNASDIALVIDAMDVLYQGLCDTFALVSSDSDFTRLVTRLRTAGKHVIVYGRQHATAAYRNRCDEFFFLEELDPAEPPAPPSAAESLPTAPPKPLHELSPEDVHDALLQLAASKDTPDGFVLLTQAGDYLHSLHPQHRLKYAGYPKLLAYLEAHPECYEVRLSGNEPTKVAAYRCLELQDAAPASTGEEAPSALPPAPLARVHLWLRRAAAMTTDPKGFTTVGHAGHYLHTMAREEHLSLNFRHYTHNSISQFIMAYPHLYELRVEERNSTTVYSYRCRPKEPPRQAQVIDP